MLCLAALSSVVGACHPVRPRGGGSSGVTLAVLPTESDRFQRAAEAITSSLADAKVRGVDNTQVSGVSLEVVQLSIECVEPSVRCYTKVGESLSANHLLFATISPADKKRLRVRVTLFDVAKRAPRTVQRVFSSEQDVSSKIGELVREATR
jgi:hypothetical protein